MANIIKTEHSKFLISYEAGQYLVIAAAIPGHDNPAKAPYEIGITHRGSGQFWHLESTKYDHQSVQEIANAIAHLLSISTEHYTPEWCQEFLT